MISQQRSCNQLRALRRIEDALLFGDDTESDGDYDEESNNIAQQVDPLMTFPYAENIDAITVPVGESEPIIKLWLDGVHPHTIKHRVKVGWTENVIASKVVICHDLCNCRISPLDSAITCRSRRHTHYFENRKRNSKITRRRNYKS